MAPSATLLRLLGLRPLRRHLGRTLLTLSGVAAGVGVFVGIELAARSSVESFSSAARAIAGPARLRVHHRPLALPESLLLALRPFADRADFHPVLETPARVGGAEGPAITILGLDIVGDGRFSGGEAPASLERLTRLFDPGALIVPRSLARRLRIMGFGTDSLTLVVGARAHRFAVEVATGGGPIRSATQTVAFLDLAPFQERFGRLGQLDWIDVAPRPGVDREALRRAIASALSGDIRVEPPEERALQMERMLDSYRRHLRALTLVSLLVGMLLAHNALLSTVLQRRAELALLRALGAPGRTLGWIIGVEAALVGLLGGAAGALVGRALSEGALRLVSRTVGSLYARTSTDPLRLSPDLWAVALLLGLGSALVAGVGPLREGLRIRPLEFLRDERPEAIERPRILRRIVLAALAVGVVTWLLRHPEGALRGYRGYLGASAALLAGALLAEPAFAGVARLLRAPLARLLHPAGRLAYATARAARRRLGVSVAALALAYAIVWGMTSLVESFRVTVDRWAEITLRADLWVTPLSRMGSPAEGTMPPAWRARLEAVPEVEAVDAFRVREILMRGGISLLGAGELDVVARHGALPLVGRADPRVTLERAAREPRTAFVSEALAMRLGIRTGDRLPLDTPFGPRAYRVLAVYRDYSSDRGYVIVDRKSYLADFGDSLVSTFGVYLSRSVAPAVGAAAVARSFGPDELVRVSDTRTLRAEVRRVLRDTFAVTDALAIVAVAVALLSVMGTLAALVLERTREIGVLRALGASGRQVIAALLLEGALVALVGLALGAATGGLVSAVLVTVLNRESFGWTLALETPWTQTALLAGLIFAAALLASVPPALRAAAVPPSRAMSRA